MSTSIRLTFRFGLILHIVGCLVFVTGAVAAAADIAEAAGVDTLDLLDIKSWALKFHGAAAMVFMVLFGYVLSCHVPQAWAANRNRISGSVMIGTFCGLMLTGYGLYYFSGEVSRSVVQWAHITLGLLEPVVLITHIIYGRRSRIITNDAARVITAS